MTSATDFDLSLLDRATVEPKTGNAGSRFTGEIPEKVQSLVDQSIRDGVAVFVPGDEEYQDAISPVIAAASEKRGMQSRVWAIYTDKDKTERQGFKFSVNKKRKPRANGETDENDDNGENGESNGE